MTIETAVYFDDGDAVSEWVWRRSGDVAKLIGCAWTDGEAQPWNYRQTSPHVGSWSPDVRTFPTRASLIEAITAV